MKLKKLLPILILTVLLCFVVTGCDYGSGTTPSNTTGNILPTDDPSATQNSTPDSTPESESNANTDTPASNTTKPQGSDTKKPEGTSVPDDSANNKEDDGVIDILILGNSLVHYNDMPSILQGIIDASGKKAVVESITRGGSRMSQFASEKDELGITLREKLRQKSYDYIIIEPSRQMSLYDDLRENSIYSYEVEAAKLLKKLADDNGAEIIIYSVFGNNFGGYYIYDAISAEESTKGAFRPLTREEHVKYLRSQHEKIAEIIGGVKLAGAGYAFENLLASEYASRFELYHTDLQHPSVQGSYLVACTFYNAIFNEEVTGNTYDHKAILKSYRSILQEYADKTMMEGLIPDIKMPTIDKDALTAADYNLLFIGANLFDDPNLLDVLPKVVYDANGKNINIKFLSHSNFVANVLVDESTDIGLRAALKDKEWDAIIIQLSRRCTISADDVEASELNAFQSVMPLLKSETDNIYIMTLNSSANPAVFTTTGGETIYTKTSNKESCTVSEGTKYFTETATKFANNLGCKTILYGEAYLERTNITSAEIAYLKSVCIYNTLFGESIPSTTTETNGLSSGVASLLRQIAEKHCLNK